MSDGNSSLVYENGIPPKPEGSTWTDGQWRAIVRRDRNLLVAAAAGSGKTAVLVQRIIRRISDESAPIDVDRLLVATFTKAAASEMRHRIGDALEDALFKRPESDHLKKQLALLNRASITTLHSFCMDVIRRYYQMIDLDPGFRIADETEADLLRQEQLEALLEERYEESPEGHPFWSLAEWFGGDRGDGPLLALIERLYEASRSHPFPESWLSEMADMFAVRAGIDGDSVVDEDHPWFASLLRDVRLELEGAAALLEDGLRICGRVGGPLPYEDTLKAELAMVRSLREASDRNWSSLYAAFLTASFGKLKPCKGDAFDKPLQEQVKALRNGAKDKLGKLREELFERTPEQYFTELAAMAPLMRELTGLTEAYAERYRLAKTDKGLVDFTDLEHLCLRILGEAAGDGQSLIPTAAALAYREQFEEILLDEYQDTNLVQEAIVALISRVSPGNRFMVGDVKQSIYRFRLAEPGLFLEKYRSYGSQEVEGEAGGGERIDLARNFRSRSQVVDGVNYLFRQVMREGVGEMEYDASAELVCGAKYPEPGNTDYSAELVLIDRGEARGAGSADEEAADSGGDPDETAGGQEQDRDAAGLPDESEEMETAQLEARLMGRRIREMMGLDGGAAFPVSEKSGGTRPAQFRDFVILLRATRNWAPVIIEELRLMGIPAYADISSGYFAATEVETVLSLLKIIDNPYQDIPLAAVLRSPMVGLTAEELAQVRVAGRQGGYYQAVREWLREAGERLRLPEASEAGMMADSGIVLSFLKPGFNPEQEEALREVAAASGGTEDAPTPAYIALAHKLLTFRRRLESWRRETRQGTLSDLIWNIYRETGYYDYVGGLPGGSQRQANLRALYDRARQYEATSFRGLFRFLRFVERMREGGGDLGTARAMGEQEDVVRIMSIHKSKGLEFPVVFVAGMGKMFNMMDLNGSFLIHKELGFGPKYRNNDLRAVYPTLPQLAIRRRMRMETLAEEMRVLYVALTRAKEKLIMQGTVGSLGSKLSRWARILGAEQPYLPDHELAGARSYLDWVVPAALRHPAAAPLRDHSPEAGEYNPEHGPYGQETSDWSFTVVEASSLASSVSGQSEESGEAMEEAAVDLMEAIRSLAPVHIPPSGFQEEIDRRLSWAYPYAGASAMLTKTSVSELKRLSAQRVLTISEEGFNWDAPMHPALAEPMPKPEIPGRRKQPDALYRLPKFRSGSKLTPAEIGTLYHTVMQHVPNGYGPDKEEVRSLLQQLEEKRILSEAERRAVDPAVIAAFFDTELGRRAAESGKIQRELPFSFGLRADQVYPDCDPAVADETLLIQGVIDCIFEDRDGRLVLLDYKTDRITGKESVDLAERYKLQLNLYAAAIEQIWKRKVDEKAVFYFDGARVVYY